MSIRDPHLMNAAHAAPQPDAPRLSHDRIKPRRGAMSLYAKDRHKRACRMIGYALTADDPAIWGQASVILSHRLTELETAALAFAALRALDPEARAMTCDAATYGDGPRDPVPSGWNLEAIAEYRAARDRRAVRP